MVWYLDRRLAEQIDEHSIKLTFDPKGPGHMNDPNIYYLEDRQNHCVVCGSTRNIISHHVGILLLS